MNSGAPGTYELLETYHSSLLQASEERRAAREAASQDRQVLMQALTAIAQSIASSFQQNPRPQWGRRNKQKKGRRR